MQTRTGALAVAAALIVAFGGSISGAGPAQTPAQGSAATSTTAGAQAPGRGGAAQPPQNLQVLPKDISREQLLATMRTFTQALGVQCNYCHVQEGRGGRNDMAADEKQPKKTARVMMHMTTHVNEMLTTDLGKADVTKVQCATCHRGSAIPKVDPPAPPAAPAQAAPGVR